MLLANFIGKKGDDVLLTAKLSNGVIISLAEAHSFAFLQQLRQQERFYCRQCEERVILKLGSKRIPHFAHEKGSTCLEQYERESQYHLAGKLRLYEWLKNLGLTPRLECYFPEIQQRADVVFTLEGKTYCVEYQCSQISEEAFMKRTKGYQKHSLQPLWILGGNNINRKSSQKISLSAFQYLFLRKSSSEQWYIPSFCPQINKFIIITNIMPLSVKNSFANFFAKPLDSDSLNYILNPPPSPEPSLKEWREEMKHYKTSLLMNKTFFKSPFFKELYSRALNPQLMPPYVGIPLSLAPVIEEPPFIWQAYFFIDVLYGRKPGQEISFSEAYLAVLKRIKKKHLHLRGLPNVKKTLFPFVLQEYLQCLKDTGVIKREGKKTFSLCEDVVAVRNMEDFAKEEEQFYRHFIIKRNDDRNWFL